MTLYLVAHEALRLDTRAYSLASKMPGSTSKTSHLDFWIELGETIESACHAGPVRRYHPRHSGLLHIPRNS